MRRPTAALVALVFLAALAFGAGSASAHHPDRAPHAVSVIKRIYPDLHARELARTPVRWQRLREAAEKRWAKTHVEYARQKRIEALVRRAQAWPIGINPATGGWHVNGANYALFTEVIQPRSEALCARAISGRETGGTYSHRVSYGFKWDQPWLGTAYGVGQGLPASKMLPWQRPGTSIYEDPVGQMHWMQAYAAGRPEQGRSLCGSLSYHLANGHW